ncbi:hypothetical protein DL96DRAFT_1637232 [Flagelloscypha sp. PMI_526]|nr:hypothetical protein DL96DRAFT_1637232 [Flagelloscypha sp. PMI_526]
MDENAKLLVAPVLFLILTMTGSLLTDPSFYTKTQRIAGPPVQLFIILTVHSFLFDSHIIPRKVLLPKANIFSILEPPAREVSTLVSDKVAFNRADYDGVSFILRGLKILSG